MTMYTIIEFLPVDPSTTELFSKSAAG